MYCSTFFTSKRNFTARLEIVVAARSSSAAVATAPLNGGTYRTGIVRDWNEEEFVVGLIHLMPIVGSL